MIISPHKKLQLTRYMARINRTFNYMVQIADLLLLGWLFWSDYKDF